MIKTRKTCVIIGCGPAGLLAAHAAGMAGYHVTVVAPKAEPSFIAGAQYLHSPIVGITDDMEPFEIQYVRVGTAEEYAKKIYGSQVTAAETSWHRFPDRVTAWSMQTAYEILWAGYSEYIRQMEVNHDNVRVLTRMADVVLNTAPRHVIEPDGRYEFETVLINTSVCEPDVGFNQIVYYGTPETSAYRSSNIRGHCSTEYPRSCRLAGLKMIQKPLRCAGAGVTGVHMLGRYGQWQKGVLVDDAYTMAVDILAGRS